MIRILAIAGIVATLTLAGCLTPDPTQDPAGANYPYVGPLATNGAPVKPPSWTNLLYKMPETPPPVLAPVTNEVKQ